MNKSGISLLNLEWDTAFFGVSSAKVILHNSLNEKDWNKIQKKIEEYQYVSIVNENSNAVNSKLISKHTNSFLVDTNIQFIKKVKVETPLPSNITLHQALEKNDQILELANFRFSKFTEDPELAKRRGSEVYYHWIVNSFNKKDKFFAISRNKEGDINGFALYSFTEKECLIELIAVSPQIIGSGVGRNLFRAIEYATFKNHMDEIKVGTQMLNLNAINFYHKVGCKQVACHQIYHLWNI